MSRVNHPSHYQADGDDGTYEVINIIEAYDLNFSLGNVLKYMLRAGRKTSAGMDLNVKEIEDLEKGLWYYQRELDRIKKEFAEKSQKLSREELDKAKQISPDLTDPHWDRIPPLPGCTPKIDWSPNYYGDAHMYKVTSSEGSEFK